MAKNNYNKLFDLIAFIGLVCVATVLILQRIFNANAGLVGALSLIGACIAYFVTAVSAFFYVRTKRNVWWYVAYTVAVVLIIVFIFLK